MQHPSAQPTIISIPSTDVAFRQHVERAALEHGGYRTPHQFERRLRRLFPRVVVRERALSGEAPSWYVYRDGAWRISPTGPWWEGARLARVVVSPDGWILEANATACGLLGVDPSQVATHHFTDFVAPGTLDDFSAIFATVEKGHDLTATLRLRPTSGEVLAVDIHATREAEAIVGVLQLAEDIDLGPTAPRVGLPAVRCLPQSDVAFRAYVDAAMSRMAEPTPDGLALRLRRLYPHAHVDDEEAGWTARRDAGATEALAPRWWDDPDLPRVRYDAQALILEANGPAQALLGGPLAGHYWQEFVTPGSTEQVSAMLAILAEVGSAESRFRMPAADGSLVEFDSFTEVNGEAFTTTMRPRS